MSGRLLLEAVEAYTAGCGLPYVGHKWSMRKLRQTADHGVLLARVDGLLYDPTTSGWQDLAERRTRLAQELLVAALCLGWDSPAASAWGAMLKGHAGRSLPPDGTATDTQWVPVRFGEDVLMEGLDKSQHIQLAVPGLLLWGLCAALGPREAVRELPTLAGALLPSPPTDDELADYVTSMSDMGLLIG